MLSSQRAPCMFTTCCETMEYHAGTCTHMVKIIAIFEKRTGNHLLPSNSTQYVLGEKWFEDMLRL